MTKKRAMAMIRELLEQADKSILDKAEHLLRSGAVDISNFHKDDYTLAKALIYTTLRDAADNWRPVGDVGKELIDNLEHF